MSPDSSASFDDWAPTYDDHVVAAITFPFAGYDDVVAAIASAALRARPDRVLELGIGTGNVARAILDGAPSLDYWGLDFSAEMLTRAGAKLPEAHLVQADLEELTSLELPRYDAAVAAYVLHEFTDERKLGLLEHLLTQRLQPSGIVVVGDVAFATVRDREETRRREAARWDPDEHYFAADEFLRQALARGIAGTFEQISSCGGLFTFRSVRN